MDDHLDPVVRQAEQVMGLDQLEPLVHERGRVDGDLRAHRPGGMLQRALARDARELGCGEAAKRAARRGDDDPLHRSVGRPLQALGESRMLAVNGQQLPACAITRLEHQRAARDEALLVGQGHVRAALERCEGGCEPGRPHHGVQHHVGTAAAHQLCRRIGPLQHRARELRSRQGRGCRVCQGDGVRTLFAGGCHQRAGAGRGGQAAQREAGMVAHDLERLHPHRAGRAQDGNRSHARESRGRSLGIDQRGIRRGR